MGVPLNHPNFHRIFPYKPSSYWGTAIYGNPHIDGEYMGNIMGNIRVDIWLYVIYNGGFPYIYIYPLNIPFFPGKKKPVKTVTGRHGAVSSGFGSRNDFDPQTHAQAQWLGSGTGHQHSLNRESTLL